MLGGLFFALPAWAAGGEEVYPQIRLQIGNPKAYLNGKAYLLTASPVNQNGTAFVPIRFLAEALGAEAKWESLTESVTVTKGEKTLFFQIGKERALVNGEPRILSQAPFLVGGSAFFPLRFLAETFGGKVTYIGTTEEILLDFKPPSPPNRPPVARFRVEKTTVAQGETVTYIDESYDPDGDLIIAQEWEGKKRAFFKPGSHKVSLRVCDEHGVWSTPAEVTVTVTAQVLHDELTYNLLYPLEGEMFTLSPLSPGSFQESEPASRKDEGSFLLFSNSPETVTREGILYQDTVARGAVRLYFYHVNGQEAPQKFYIFASHPGPGEAVTITLRRKGVSGPSPDFYAVGKRGLERYLRPQKEETFVLLPGEKRVLNPEAPSTSFGECSHGIFDLSTSGPVTFSFVAVAAARHFEDILAVLPSLPLLPRDSHVRGTFPQADRLLEVTPKAKTSLLLADGIADPFLLGQEATETNLTVVNKGNYGVLYRLGIEAPPGQDLAVILTSPAGGFAGAFTFNGKTYPAPRTGILRTREKGILLGIAQAGRKKELLFVPPAASWLPVKLLFVPVPPTG